MTEAFLRSALRVGSLCLLPLVMVSAPARAGLNDIVFDNPIERAAARANQAVYDQLTTGPSAPCSENFRTPSGACSGVIYETFQNVRELVHTANDLTDSGPTEYSLGVDREGLGFALRWTAAEEVAAQGRSATQFSSNQLSSLSNRISALRFGARGGRTVMNANSTGDLYANEAAPLGGAAGADPEGGIASRWSAFVDGSYGYGRKSDTSDPFRLSGSGGSEDAFDFDGQEISAGVDYRVNSSWVVGVLVGYTDRAIDFDSSVSIVDGTIDAKGGSMIFYGLWEHERYYATASIGAQKLKYDMVRRITYPSLNPLVASVDVTTTSDTDSTALLGTLGGGAVFNLGAFSAEPYVKGEYQDIKLDGFTEAGSSGFEFNYGKQNLKSFDVAAGLKLQYVFTPPFGVIVPYLRGEFHKELENDSRNISAQYAGLPSTGLTAAENFNLATDAPDKTYMIGAAGFSVVLPHGLQGFVQFQKVFSLDTFDDRAITGGIRLEF